MLYSPLSIFFEKTRLLFKKRVQDGQLAYLGDSDLPGAQVEIKDKIGYVYARFPGGVDANGNAKFSTPFPVRSAGAAFPNYPGAPVYVAYGKNNELQIVEAHYATLDKAGIDTRILNPLHQQSKWVYKWQLTIGLASAVANNVNDSFLVTVKKYLRYFDNVFASAETGEQADKVDLSAYMPATDMHCYAAVWLDAYTGEYEVTASTAQSLFSLLDDTDLQEVVAQRPPDAIPHKAFYLANNAGTIRQNAVKDRDVRQFLNMPQVHGFPNPVTYRERIHPDKQVLFAGSLVVTGSLEVLGSLVGVPTVGDSDSGTSPTAATGWQDDGTVVRLVTPTDNVNVGGTANIAKVGIDGDTDEIQLLVQAHSTQTNPLMVLENSAGTDLVHVTGDGRIGLGAAPDAALLKDSVSTTKAERIAPMMSLAQRDAMLAGLPDGSVLATNESGVGYYQSVFGGKASPIGFSAPVCDARLSVDSANPLGDASDASTLYLLPVASGIVWANQGGGFNDWIPFYISEHNLDIESSLIITGNTVSGSPTVSNLSTTANVYPGMSITGTGIPGSTTISSVGSTTLTLSANASATNTGVSLTVTLAASKVYDVFFYAYSYTTPRLDCIAWTNDTTRATAITKTGGIWFKDSDKTRRYIGSFRTNASSHFDDNGTSSPPKRLVWNLDHPDERPMRFLIASDSYSRTSTTIRQMDGSPTNQFEVLTGLDLYSTIDIHLTLYGNTGGTACGVGLDTTTAFTTGNIGMIGFVALAGDHADYCAKVPLGYHVLSGNERGVASNTFLGDNGNPGFTQSGGKAKFLA